jgi:predicted lipoprotein with Yx(FWY)xxD motif
MTPTVEVTGPTTGTTMAEITINVGESTLGQILIGEAGRTLYAFTNDKDGTSTCYDSCAQNWPPALTSGVPRAESGVDAQMLGTTARTDGTLQVTYHGMPLYYFAGDTAAGDVNGEGVGAVWFVVAPSGELIRQP